LEATKRKYLVELSAVCQFVSAVEFDSLPFVSLPILGTFNLRGEILTLVQLDKEKREEFTLVMIVEHKGSRYGIGIQAVRDILTIEHHLFRPDLTDFSQCSMILGGEVVRLLDLGSLLSRRPAYV
jgi:chemotaxis signal transduction protein